MACIFQKSREIQPKSTESFAHDTVGSQSHLLNFWGSLGDCHEIRWVCIALIIALGHISLSTQAGLLDTLQLILDAAAVSTAVVIAPGHHPACLDEEDATER